MIFGKKKEKDDYCIVIIKGELYHVDSKVKEYINQLEEIQFEKRKLERELETIKPVLENPDLKQALSEKCNDCRFVVRSKWNGHILGCKKGIVCDDYEREIRND